LHGAAETDVMSRWWNPLSRWLGSDSEATAVATPAARRPDAQHPPTSARPSQRAANAGPVDTTTDPETRRRFLAWLLARTDDGAGGPPSAEVQRLLDKLDHVIGSETLRASLLPRAPQVVPQLMKTLRDEAYSSVDVAGRISKDVVLTAEVIRSATSAYQRTDDGKIDLARAVAVIGAAGLRRAIANVVLRPIFEAKGDSLSARASAQVWKDADRKARLCAAIASGSHGLDQFDGYIAGLLHDTGWTAALRAIDGFPDARAAIGQLLGAAVAPELFIRRDRLFGALVQGWSLGDAVTALAVEVGRDGLAAASTPLGLALASADRLAMLFALAPKADGADTVPEWATLPRSVQNAYDGLGAD
jgi:HD-like signal output (HDOD) protein